MTSSSVRVLGMTEDIKEIIRLAVKDQLRESSLTLPGGALVVVRHPKESEIESIHQLTQSEITVTTAALPVIKAVYKHNADCVWGIYHSADGSRENLQFTGYYSFLHLNAAGLAALEKGELNGSNPDLSLVVPYGQRPAALYVWAVVARRITRFTIPLIARALGPEVYGGLPIYTTAGTMGGLSAVKHYGFASARPAQGGLGHLYRLDPPVPQRGKTEAA